METDKIIELSNKLTIEDMQLLMTIFANRISVFIGQHNKVLFTGDLSTENPVTLNGANIQINMEYVDKKNSFLKQYKEYLKW